MISMLIMTLVCPAVADCQQYAFDTSTIVNGRSADATQVANSLNSTFSAAAALTRSSKQVSPVKEALIEKQAQQITTSRQENRKLARRVGRLEKPRLAELPQPGNS